ncbi:MAG: serine/threonine-protein kinase [Planctomycetota bacterium]
MERGMLEGREARLAARVIEMGLARREHVRACAALRAGGDARPLARLLLAEGVLTLAQLARVEAELDGGADPVATLPLDGPPLPLPSRGSELDPVATLPMDGPPLPLPSRGSELDPVATLPLDGPPLPLPEPARSAAADALVTLPLGGPPPSLPPEPPRRTERLETPPRPTPPARPAPAASAKDDGVETFMASPAYHAEAARSSTPPPQPPPAPLDRSVEDLVGAGDVLGGYQVLELLGRGGMGVVHLAYSPRLERYCAIKTIQAADRACERAVRRFHNEAVLAARLRHPHIVSVFDAGEEGGRFYIVMERVEGRSLTEQVGATKSKAELEACLRLLVKVARAIDYAHERGVTHRDLKPENVLVDLDGEPRITDFGLAAGGEELRAGTQSGQLMGSLHYLPPEQANGELGRIGPRSDVYGLGATLYHVLAGEPPFAEDPWPRILFSVMESDPPPPSGLARKAGRPLGPPDLDTVCLKAMEKEAARRYPSAAAFADDLEAALDDRPISARPATAGERAARLVRRHRGLAASVAVVLGVSLVLGAAFLAVVLEQARATRAALQAADQAAALEHAGTVVRAIRVDMLTGRADLARAFAARRADDAGPSVAVVRPDRSFAYVDGRTAARVAARLRRHEVQEEVAREFPQLVPAIAELQRTGLPSIDRSAHDDAARFDGVDPEVWRRALSTRQPQLVQRQVEGVPHLLVLVPIENERSCQACHGPPALGGGLYEDDNQVRAVVVVDRSQADLEERLRRDQRATALTGCASAAALVALVLLLGGLGGAFREGRRFGVASE